MGQQDGIRTESSVKTSSLLPLGSLLAAKCTYFPEIPCNRYSVSRRIRCSGKCGRPILVRYSFNNPALDLPFGSLAGGTESAGLDVAVKGLDGGGGGASDGRNAGDIEDTLGDRDSAWRNCNDACFLDNMGCLQFIGYFNPNREKSYLI